MMNIYDFDGTIYNGDSSVDFFKYCLKKNKMCILKMPKILFACFLYFIKVKEKEYFKSKFFEVVKCFENIDDVVEEFWKIHDYKIKEMYKGMHKKSDIVISASPEFLLSYVAKKYKFKLIATNVDKKTGKLLSKNCYGAEKVKRLKDAGIDQCENFYTDSYSDYPMTKISKNSYFFLDDHIIKFEDYKESKIKKIKKEFFNPDFVTFVFIGLINVFNGVLFALIYSKFIANAVLAYVVGFSTSVIVSYLLNSILNFKKKLSFRNMCLFLVNNIPNFLIQLFSVIFFVDVLKFSKFTSYFISAIIAVPITFLLVKYNVFKKER